MKILLAAVFLAASLLAAKGSDKKPDGGYVAVGYDSADQVCYSRGWVSGVGREISYGEWHLLREEPAKKSSAGHYLATVDSAPELGTFSQTRAFAMFANGPGFEESVAQRTFNAKISKGDVFSACLYPMKFGGGRSWAEEEGSVGVILSTEAAIERCADYDKGAVLEFGAFPGKKNYMLRDGDGEHDTGCAVLDGPVSVSFEFLEGGRYRGQVAKLGKDISDVLEVVDCPERSLRGEVDPKKIRSMVFYNRNGDLCELYFDDIVLDRHAAY